ncbi:tetratricopeptide repeat-containing sensor histidine kinase [Flavobacterium faecale]|uniref:tetratricopeptide repeat-containing sensor histidine kinase n=1 Tax=Flavobacterium faecale TaxID=1355330 RepID=UPI003AAC3424
MQHSPIFILLLFISLVCCQKRSEDNTVTQSKNLNHRLATQLSVKADSYYVKNKFDSAFFNYDKSKELFEKEKDSAFIAYTLIRLARIQQTYGDYINSEETLTEALEFTKKNTDYRYAIHNLLGIAAKELENYDDAIVNYNYILKTVKKPILRVTPLNNMAKVYIDQKKYPEAIALLDPIVQSNLLDSLPNKKAILMDNLGFAYTKNGMQKKGLALMIDALTLRIRSNDNYGAIASHLHLANYYQNSDAQKSRNHAKLAYQKASITNSVDEQLQALSYLMLNTFERRNNSYLQSFLKLNDSILKVRNNAKNQFAKIKYDATKATLENIKYKEERAGIALELQTKKNQNYIFTFGVILLLLTIAFLVHYFKNKNNQARLQASYLTETRIAKQLHDELANDVFFAMTFAETQDLLNPTKKEMLLDNLDKIYKRTRNISKENNTIDTGESFEANLKQMLTSYKSTEIAVIIKNQNPIDWSKITADKKIAIQRVLQELMVNMKKYSQANFVIIGFDTVENKVIIDYSDNGIGCSQQLILKNGLRNAENRIHTINGLLTFDTQTQKGFKAKITIPK